MCTVSKSIFRFTNEELVHSFLKKKSAPNKTMRKDSMSYHENFCPDAHASSAYDWKCVHQLLRAPVSLPVLIEDCDFDLGYLFI